MVTLSPESGTHPRRQAALAAHTLRGALASAGLLAEFPECRGDVIDGQPIVMLGQVGASGARQLADLVNRGIRNKRRKPAATPDSASQDTP